MSIYLRFKRKNQTIFLHGEPGEPLSELKKRLAVIVDEQADDIQIFAFFDDQEKEQIYEERLKQIEAEAKMRSKKREYGKHNNDQKDDSLINNDPDYIPPLDELHTISELNLENDDIVFFVFRDNNSEWEEVDVPGLQEQGDRERRKQRRSRQAKAVQDARVAIADTMISMETPASSSNDDGKNNE